METFGIRSSNTASIWSSLNALGGLRSHNSWHLIFYIFEPRSLIGSSALRGAIDRFFNYFRALFLSMSTFV